MATFLRSPRPRGHLARPCRLPAALRCLTMRAPLLPLRRRQQPWAGSQSCSSSKQRQRVGWKRQQRQAVQPQAGFPTLGSAAPPPRWPPGRQQAAAAAAGEELGEELLPQATGGCGLEAGAEGVGEAEVGPEAGHASGSAEMHLGSTGADSDSSVSKPESHGSQHLQQHGSTPLPADSSLHGRGPAPGAQPRQGQHGMPPPPPRQAAQQAAVRHADPPPPAQAAAARQQGRPGPAGARHLRPEDEAIAVGGVWAQKAVLGEFDQLQRRAHLAAPVHLASPPTAGRAAAIAALPPAGSVAPHRAGAAPRAPAAAAVAAAAGPAAAVDSVAWPPARLPARQHGQHGQRQGGQGALGMQLEAVSELGFSGEGAGGSGQAAALPPRQPYAAAAAPAPRKRHRQEQAAAELAALGAAQPSPPKQQREWEGGRGQWAWQPEAAGGSSSCGWHGGRQQEPFPGGLEEESGYSRWVAGLGRQAGVCPKRNGAAPSAAAVGPRTQASLLPASGACLKRFCAPARRLIDARSCLGPPKPVALTAPRGALLAPRACLAW